MGEGKDGLKAFIRLSLELNLPLQGIFCPDPVEETFVLEPPDAELPLPGARKLLGLPD